MLKLTSNETNERPAAEPHAGPLIEIRGLNVRLSGRDILKNINISLDRGKTLAVMGLSGVGKSTLLRCIIGLMKPASGEIFLEGREITRLKHSQLDEIRKSIGMVFQSPALFDSMTIADNVAFGLREHTKMPEEEIQRNVAEKLALVDLAGMGHLLPSQLSGGMQKRASIARAIITNPKIILYDEPTTGLDPIICNVINHLIMSLRKQLGVTSIVVTHDLESAFLITDEIAMLIGGEIVEKGPPDIIKDTNNPYVRQFVEGSLEGPIRV
jgi:phospholipid/cholesterol/gamma-HCH transport system ATP-binding protein